MDNTKKMIVAGAAFKYIGDLGIPKIDMSEPGLVKFKGASPDQIKEAIEKFRDAGYMPSMELENRYKGFREGLSELDGLHWFNQKRLYPKVSVTNPMVSIMFTLEWDLDELLMAVPYNQRATAEQIEKIKETYWDPEKGADRW